MATDILDHSFDPFQAIYAHQQATVEAKKFGAAATFIGTMRDFNEGETVQSMVLEHYPEMTSRYLKKLEKEAHIRWDLLDLLIIHRVGNIQPNDPIVAIACWSAHRRASLDACAWLIETLKCEAPFWKKETSQDGERWVTKNTDGH